MNVGLTAPMVEDCHCECGLDKGDDVEMSEGERDSVSYPMVEVVTGG